MPAGVFLRRHWQKQPLLARGALPECGQLVQREGLFELAARDDVESRLVRRRGSDWRVQHGPFEPRELQRLPRRNWTLLVHGVNHALPAAQRLLDAFDFIPYARLDDLMVSYAPPGGGVGPHFDNYDVFLLQGEGRRRWRISRQRDLALVEGAPLKLLRRFRPQREWLLDTGDLLYLPPRCAHDGVAMAGDCITYSIGFRAFEARELGNRFLDYLQDDLRLSGIYADPALAAARRPARLDDAMIRGAQGFLQRIRWTRGDVARFLGCYLTEPKAHVIFARPARPLPAPAFAAGARRRGLKLSLPTRMLFRGSTLFINGEAGDVGAGTARLLSRLADRRSLPPRAALNRESADVLYRWYRAGYIQLGDG
jgi:50S ribosomal protein L16 3-hydroxylase